MPMTQVRVRYAPSPTGYPHIGNIRTALFNWLFARHSSESIMTKGSFILRIEDTDMTRKVEGAVDTILESLRWLGLDWDEGPEVGGDFGPYFQSQRLNLYQSAAKQMIEQGYAYPCYCSPERLDELRTRQMQRKQPTGYDRHCRDLTLSERSHFEEQGIIPVVRFKIPPGKTTFRDLIRGNVTFSNNTLDDFIILKSDGFPTYHLANVVDDHLMQISHVLRADEWLSSTPRHILMYQSLGYEPPLFAHLTMIMGPDHTKLSKRYGATSLIEYRQQGYLPEAIINFLALLGWSLDDKTTIISREDLIKHFSLERLSKTAAVFDIKKLNWMNGVYIRQLSSEEFTQRALPFLENGLPHEMEHPLYHNASTGMDYVSQIAPLIQERVRYLAEVPELSRFFFTEILEYDTTLLLQKGMDKERATSALQTAHERLSILSSFDASSLEELLRPLAVELNLKTGELFGLLRVATTGQTAAPPLFQTMAVLGKEQCLKRIALALEKLLTATS